MGNLRDECRKVECENCGVFSTNPVEKLFSCWNCGATVLNPYHQDARATTRRDFDSIPSSRVSDKYPLVGLAGLAALMLVGALGRWPYGYYVLLRWVVSGAGVVVFIAAITEGRHATAWTFAGVVLLFNPLVPIHLDREIWGVIDLASATVFAYAAFVVGVRGRD